MSQREFITLLGVAVVWPPSARPPVRRIFIKGDETGARACGCRAAHAM